MSMTATLCHRAAVLAALLAGLATTTASRAETELPAAQWGAGNPAIKAVEAMAVNPARHPDPAALEAYIDGVIDSYRQRDGIAGITLAMP